ncbi:MAG: GntR family transcriptional regulator [marine bacterium B5-7]|nr:MAG: GntR family transcriptional regulator [marine bacterium B5-7]
MENLAAEFNVAIVTVRQAVSILEEEGLVTRQQGRGTFVSKLIAERRWVTLESSWDTMLRKWKDSTARIINEKDTVVKPVMDTSDGVPAPAYHFLRRVHLSNNIPYAVINIYIDQRLYSLAPNRFEKEMVILVLESLENVDICSATQTLTIDTADVEVANLLEIPINSPVGEVRRVITDHNDVAIYVGEATYRGDLVKLERTLTPSKTRK